MVIPDCKYLFVLGVRDSPREFSTNCTTWQDLLSSGKYVVFGKFESMKHYALLWYIVSIQLTCSHY